MRVENHLIISSNHEVGLTDFSVDRYFLVCHAAKYPDIMTRRRCWFCILFIWVRIYHCLDNLFVNLKLIPTATACECDESFNLIKSWRKNSLN